MVIVLPSDGIRGFSFICDVWGFEKLKFQIFFEYIFSNKKLDVWGYCVGGSVPWEAESEMEICMWDALGINACGRVKGAKEKVGLWSSRNRNLSPARETPQLRMALRSCPQMGQRTQQLEPCVKQSWHAGHSGKELWPRVRSPLHLRTIVAVAGWSGESSWAVCY